jgi:hypothetical protein
MPISAMKLAIGMASLMLDNPPEGYSFVDCNWKKRKAKFVKDAGGLKFVAF